MTDLEQRIESALPLVRSIARKLYNTLPNLVSVPDLIQEGMVGLIEAAPRYDESHGASFATYVAKRVRGAMLDSLRRDDWVPRSMRTKAKKDGTEHELRMVIGFDDDLCNDDAPLDGSAEAGLHSDPVVALTDSELSDELLSMLDRRSQRLMRLYYLERLTMREIGVLLGVSESRISQLHRDALELCRKELVHA